MSLSNGRVKTKKTKTRPTTKKARIATAMAASAAGISKPTAKIRAAAVSTTSIMPRPITNSFRVGRRSRNWSRSSSWTLSATPGLMAYTTLVWAASRAGLMALITSTTKADTTAGRIPARLTAGSSVVVCPSWLIRYSIRGTTPYMVMACPSRMPSPTPTRPITITSTTTMPNSRFRWLPRMRRMAISRRCSCTLVITRV